MSRTSAGENACRHRRRHPPWRHDSLYLGGLMLRYVSVLLLLTMSLSACSQYRLAIPQNVEIPNYEPRLVLVPENCLVLIERAATSGMALFSEAEAREVLFCQQQQIIRTQEEEAATKRLEAHAEAA